MVGWRCDVVRIARLAVLPECAFESTTDFAGAQEPFLFTYAPPRATEMVPLDSANRGSGFLQTSRLA